MNEKLNYPDYCNEDVRCDEVCENGCPWLNEDGECNISNAMVYRELEVVRNVNIAN